METIYQIITIVSVAVPLLITALTFILKFIGTAKSKKLAENIQKIGDAVIPFIKKAEEFTHYTGLEKKEFVMTQATKFAVENGIKFNAEDISNKIEELVKLTKEVNGRPKDIENAKCDKSL